MRRAHFLNPFALAAALAAIAGTVTPVRAQDPDDLQRGVARISVMNGDVNVRRGDSGDWVAGVINAPLMTGDHIATGPASRAEIEFDASNVLRLGANAEVNLAQLEYGRYQLELARGLSTFRILRPNDVNIEIDTPSVSVRPSRAGSVRILVSDAGETEVTARGGDVEVFTPRGSQWIRSGQTMMARGSSADPEFQIVAAGGLDDWDRWCDSRDRAELQSASAAYVPPGVYGTEDLDNYGNWVSVPEYGNVWSPTVAADWSPYYYGRWSWLDWYGWSWVSYDPWGWAPYHYGRWFHNDRFGWCWYPGLRTSRHYWSPALVAFVGFGGGGGLGFGFGNVGWVPLAPYEVYHPWWGRNWYGSGGYFNHQVNIVNVNIGNTYRNARYNGISAVGYRDFADGRFNHVTRFNGSQIHEVGAIHGAMPFTPGNQNLRFSDRNVANVPRSAGNTHFFRSQTPNPAQRVPFQQQVGRGGNSGVNTAARENGYRGQSAPAANVQGQSGWRRFGQTPSGSGAAPAGPSRVERGGFGNSGNRQQQTAQPQSQQRSSPAQRKQQVAPRQDSRGGWQRFGSPGNGGSTPQATPRQQSPSAPSNSDRGGRSFGQPRQEYMNQPRGSGGNSGGAFNRQETLRVAPPVVHERPSYSAPRYSAPRQSAPSYSAPRYSAPRQSAPSYSAPRQSAPRQSAPSRSAPSGGGSHGGGGGRHGR